MYIDVPIVGISYQQNHTMMQSSKFLLKKKKKVLETLTMTSIVLTNFVYSVLLLTIGTMFYSISLELINLN